MPDLTIANAAPLTGAQTAGGDLFPLLDVSAAPGAQGSKITRDELRIALGVIPAVALTYATSLTPDCNDGLSRSITLTGDCVINAPTNGADGTVLMLRFVASGASRELTYNSAIKLPTGATYEATVASGSTRIAHLEYNGSLWMLVKNLEFTP
jgi:hypothetical protein